MRFSFELIEVMDCNEVGEYRFRWDKLEDQVFSWLEDWLKLNKACTQG